MKIKSLIIKLTRKSLIHFNSKLTKSFLRNSTIPPISYCGVDENSHNANSLKSAFTFTHLFSLLGHDDWPLYQDFLYSQNLVIIGGYRGKNLKRFLMKDSIESIHIYEPISSFAKDINEQDNRIKVFQEAVGETPGIRPFILAEDYSCFADIKRDGISDIGGEIEVQVVDLLTVFQRISGDWTLFMNCEGAEYEILRNLSKYMESDQFSLPKAIVFQSHKTSEIPSFALNHTRQLLSTQYIDLLTFDLCCDIWYLKKFFD